MSPPSADPLGTDVGVPTLLQGVGGWDPLDLMLDPDLDLSLGQKGEGQGGGLQEVHRLGGGHSSSRNSSSSSSLCDSDNSSGSGCKDCGSTVGNTLSLGQESKGESGGAGDEWQGLHLKSSEGACVVGSSNAQGVVTHGISEQDYDWDIHSELLISDSCSAGSGGSDTGGEQGVDDFLESLGLGGEAEEGEIPSAGDDGEVGTDELLL